MLPVDALKSVRKVVVHANCPDGRASALILHAALPDAEVCEMAYGTPEHNALRAVPGMLFCDFTPPKGRLGAFVAEGSAVLDHHSRDLVSPFGDLGIFGENAKGESGAVLAYQHVLVPLRQPMPRPGATASAFFAAAESLAVLSAVRDTWQRDSALWDRACELAEVLRFVPLDEALKMGIPGVMRMTETLGPLLMRKKRDAASEAAANAVVLSVSGRNVAVIPSVSLTSDVADLVASDIVAGFDYAQEDGGNRIRLIVSLRGRNGTDVRAIAQRHGGGGHVPAAGFSLPVDAGTARNPYYAIAAALEV